MRYRIVKFLFFLFFFIGFNSANAQSVKGLYVDGFSNIIGNTQREDSLLLYAQSNGFNYLALYDLHIVQTMYDLTTVATSAPVANFINRAKTMYGIQKIGAIAENEWFFQNRIHVYNQQHTNANQKFDVYNLEFEFWQTSLTGPAGYYCTTYLQPASYSCDTAGAFAFYISELHKIDSLANLDNAISETYVGWPNAGQCRRIAITCDRVLVHAYVTSDANEYSYTQTRLSYFAGTTNPPAHIIVIFSSEPAFMGPWLQTHPETQAFATYSTAFQNDPSAWTSNIDLQGYQWFDYSNMPYLLLHTDEQDPAMTMNYWYSANKIQLEMNSERNFSAVVEIHDLSGRLLFHDLLQISPSQSNYGIQTDLGQGAYILSLTDLSSGKMSSGKFLVTR